MKYILWLVAAYVLYQLVPHWIAVVLIVSMVVETNRYLRKPTTPQPHPESTVKLYER